jgi:hypothetical protein
MHEWVIERNAMNLMVTMNQDLRNFLGSHGCIMREHFTGKNKWDVDFGVASMSMLFDGALENRGLIRLPSRSQNEGVKFLIEQLVTWFPETKAKTDTVMALWFAELGARNVANGEISNQFNMNNEFLSENDKRKQTVVDLDYLGQMWSEHGQA